MKKYIVLLLTFAMVLSIAACGKTKPQETQPQEETNVPQQADTNKPSEETSKPEESKPQESKPQESKPEAISEPDYSDDLFGEAEKLREETLQYPSQNDNFKYDVYETYVAIKEYIGDSATVEIPETIDELPVKVIEYDFQDSKPFDEVIIPASVINIRVGAFSGLPLKRVVFESDNQIVMQYSAFSHCVNLEDMDGIIAHIYGEEIPENLFGSYPTESIFDDNDYGVDPNMDTEVVIPDNITTIGDSAFRGLWNLKNVSFGKVEFIGEEAFADCRSLEAADLTNVTAIGEGAFASCDSLKSATFSDVDSIPERAFYDCHNIEVLDIGNASSVGDEAIQYSVKNLYIRNKSCDISFSSMIAYYEDADFTVHGYPGSTAAAFASERGCKFEPIK